LKAPGLAERLTAVLQPKGSVVGKEAE